VVDVEYDIVEIIPGEVHYDIFVSGEESLPESDRTEIPEEIRREYDEIQARVIQPDEYESLLGDDWAEEAMTLTIRGSLVNA
jgi:hypothetical protein